MRKLLGLAYAFLALAACAQLDTSEVALESLNFPNPSAVNNLAAGNNNDYAISGVFTVIDLNANAAGSTLTGVDRTAYVDGDAFMLRNHSAALSVTIANQSASSLANNRFILPFSQDVTLQPRQSMWFYRNDNAGGFAPVAWSPSLVVTSTNTAPGRAFNTTFTPSATTDVEVYYSIKIQTGLTLTTGAHGQVDLACDANATPTTIVQTISNESTGTLAIGLNLQASNTLVVRYRVPRAQNCRLNTTNVVGTPVYTLVRQVEQTQDLI